MLGSPQRAQYREGRGTVSTYLFCRLISIITPFRTLFRVLITVLLIYLLSPRRAQHPPFLKEYSLAVGFLKGSRSLKGFVRVCIGPIYPVIKESMQPLITQGNEGVLKHGQCKVGQVCVLVVRDV